MTPLLRGDAGSQPRLRALLETARPVLAPGCYDALGARLIEEAGFPAVSMTGFGASAGLIGPPQVGLVLLAEMVEKVRAAVDARASSDLLIIARTDARAVEGLDAAIERAARYREAGADVLFIEAPQSVEEIRAIAAAFPSVPLLFNYAEGGKTPPIELGQQGVLDGRCLAAFGV